MKIDVRFNNTSRVDPRAVAEKALLALRMRRLVERLTVEDRDQA